MHEFGQSLSCPTVESCIYFSREEWLLLKPQTKTYADKRDYLRFDEIWTTIFNSKIWDTLKSSCKWKFHDHRFHSRRHGAAFTFDAYCTDKTDKKRPCGNYLYGKCLEIPETAERIEIQIITRDTKDIPHTQKREIAGKARKNEKNSAKNTKAGYYQVKQANLLMETSDLIPAHLPNLATIRKIQQEQRDDSMNLDLYPGDPLTSLLKIQSQNSFVRFLSISPFYIHLVSNEQVKLYHEALDRGYDTCSIDASGFSQAFEIWDNCKTGALFLYEICFNIDGKIGSVGQMLSEAHDTCTIADWLSRWLELVVRRPRAIVVDGSLALLNAITLTFYDSQYEVYIDYCYKLVREYEKNKEVLEDSDASNTEKERCKANLKFILKLRPDVLTFRDRNHIIKNVRHWKCFENYKDWRVSDFYTRIVGYMLSITTLKLFKETLKQVIIVCCSDVIGLDSTVSEDVEALITKIQSFSYELSYEGDGQSSNANHYTSFLTSEDFSKVNANNKNYEIVKDIDEIYNHSLQFCELENKKDLDDDFPNPNPYKCPELKDDLLPLCYQLISWCNIVDQLYDDDNYNDDNNIIKTKTSCHSESRFNVLKNSYHLKVLKVNKFILRYMTCVSGESHLIRGALKLQSLRDKNEKNVARNDKKENAIAKSDCLNMSTLSRSIFTDQGSINYPVQQNFEASTHHDHFEEKELTIDATLLTNKSLNNDLTITLVNLPLMDGSLRIFRIYRGNELIKYSLFSYESSYWSNLHQSNLLSLDSYEIECLKASNWINNFVIDLYMAVKYETGEWKKIGFLSCYYTELILGKYSKSIFKRPHSDFIFTGAQFSENCYDMVFLPYSLDDHWCLVVLDFRNSTFTHYDTLRWNRDDVIKRKFDNFLEYCKTIKRTGPCNFSSRTWKKIVPGNEYPKQIDGHSCGLFVMLIMDGIATNKNISTIPLRPNMFRRKILDFFNNHCSKDICLSPSCHKTEKRIFKENKIQTNKNIRTCKICNRWKHETCHPKSLLFEDICLMCFTPDNGDSNRFGNNSPSKFKFPGQYTDKIAVKDHQIDDNSTQKTYKGLYNPIASNSCWLNSAIQVFFSLPEFTNLAIIYIGGSDLLDSFIDLIQTLEEMSPSKSVSSAKLKNACQILQSSFSTNEQQDVVEFIDKFLDYMMEQCSSWNQNSCEISFDHSMLTYSICEGCSRQRTIADHRHFMIRIPINKSNQSIDELIEQNFTSHEELVEMECTRCQEKLINHNVIRKLVNFPKILLVQLKRFEQKNKFLTKKINYPVDITEDLVLSSNIRKPLEGLLSTDAKYNLKAIICHHGTLISSGHYTSWVKHENDWYHFNDDKVVKATNFINVKNSVKQSSYFLVFTFKKLIYL